MANQRVNKRKAKAVPTPAVRLTTRQLRMPARTTHAQTPPAEHQVITPTAVLVDPREAKLLDRMRAFTNDFGEPILAWVENDIHIYVWCLNPEGFGIVNARRSILDTKGGQSLHGQATEQLEELKRRGRTPALLVVSERLSGRLDLELRPDIAFIQACLYAGNLAALEAHPAGLTHRWNDDAWAAITRPGGWCRWLSWFSADRMARNEEAALRIYRVMTDLPLELHLTHEVSQGPVDWERDRHLLRFASMNSTDQANLISKHAKRGRKHQLKEGKVDARRLPFGFRNGPDEKPTDVLPGESSAALALARERDAIRDIFTLMAEGGATGTANQIVQHLKKRRGISMHASTAINIVRDHVHCDGIIELDDEDGTIYELDQVPLVDPISESLYRRANAQADIRVATSIKLPAAQFAAAGIRVLCATCIERLGLKDAPSWVGGKRKRRYVYYRREPSPGCTCEGWRIDQEDFERKLHRQLVRAATELPGPALVTDDERADMTARLAELEAACAAVRPNLFPLPDTVEERIDKYDRVMGAVDTERHQLERRMSAIDTLEATPLTSGPPLDRDLMLWALQALLRDDGWDDPYYRALVVKAYAATVAYVVIRKNKDDDDFELDLIGRAPEPGVPTPQALYPLQALAPLLYEFLVELRTDGMRAEMERAEAASAGGGGAAAAAAAAGTATPEQELEAGAVDGLDVWAEGHSGSQGMPNRPLCPSPGLVQRRRLKSQRQAARPPASHVLPESAWSIARGHLAAEVE